MATGVPDPKTFASWEDAFQYPIAAVRGIERQLRIDIASNREKLRSLVGASYRDLLGTAETILEMDSQMQSVETYLGNMGVKCNSRLLDKRAINLRAWNDYIHVRDKERYVLASQLAVLRACPEAISRLLKGGGSVLQAAKILVISRLMHKKLSQRTDIPPYLEVLRNRLASLRRKIILRIDRRFKSPDASEPVLVEAMCAFSLATSSSATDVLSHFHHIRQSAMSDLGQVNTDDKSIFKALGLFVKTLRDCQDMIPMQLARALEQLKTSPLLHSPDLRSLIELNFDIHQQWLGEDINGFTPYVRHDDLRKADATKLLRQWAKNAFSTFLGHLGHKLGRISDPAVVVDLRHRMLELWFSNQRHLTAVDTSEVLDGVRAAFNNRLQELIHQHCAGLGKVASAVSSLLERWEAGVSDACPTMWDHAITSTDYSSGGKVLKEALSVRAYGRTTPVDAVSVAYSKWLDGMRNLENVIRKLREKRWTDGLDDLDDDDDDVLENRRILLSEDDPRLLQDTLQKGVEQTFHKLQHQIRLHTEDLQATDDFSRSPAVGQKSCFLLRVWREIISGLPSNYPNSSLESTLARDLQAQICKVVLHQPLICCIRRISRTSRQHQHRVRILWEGDPQLPVLPSPYAFRLLHDVVRSMAGFGADIWTPQAVKILQHQLRQSLAPVMGEFPQVRTTINGHSPRSPPNIIQVSDEAEEANNSGPSNKQDNTDNDNDNEKHSDTKDAHPTEADGDAPEEPTGPSEQVVRDIKIQRLFDMLYLQNATGAASSDANDALGHTQSTIEANLQLPPADTKRLKKSAEAYWTRTKLLFALLA
ncbi:MAG: hypothetical protein Q9207_006823 [Kuettlingeria erythrocarpa]